MSLETSTIEGRFLVNFADLNRNYSCLEVGCGNGRLSKILADNSQRFIGIDSDKELIKTAKEIHPHVHFLHTELENLNFDGLKFDRIIFTYSFHHLKNFEIGLKHAINLLNEGGKICIEEPFLDGQMQKFYEILTPEKDKLIEAEKVIRKSETVILKQLKTAFPYKFNDENETLHFFAECENYNEKKEELKQLIGEIKSKNYVIQEEVQLFLIAEK